MGIGHETSLLERGEGEHPVPDEWRRRFELIVGHFMVGDFQLTACSDASIGPIDPERAGSIAEIISAYGTALAKLSPAIWERSIYVWMDGYWEFLIDLTTEDEEVSDLALSASLADAPGARLTVRWVHVP